MSMGPAIPLALILSMGMMSCSSPLHPDPPTENRMIGQVVSDVVYAVLKPDGTVWTWGWNAFGTMGDGTTINSDVPVQVVSLSNVIGIDFKEGIGVAADSSGDIWFWGNYFFYATNPDFENTVVKEPVKISKLQNIVSLDIIHRNIYLLQDDGTVWFITIDVNAPRTFIEPARVPDVSYILEISDYLALTSNGTLHPLRDFEQSHGGPIDGVQDIISLQHFYNRRTVILKKDSTVWAWGRNGFGELGNGSFEDSATPVRVGGLTNVIAISANYDYNLALKKDGTVWFWGLADPGAKSGQNLPVKIEGLEDVSAIYASKTSIVAKHDGSYWLFDSEKRLPVFIPFD